MPRVHGIRDSDLHRRRRNRHNNHNLHIPNPRPSDSTGNLLLRDGSIFSLPTPFIQPRPQQHSAMDTDGISANGTSMNDLEQDGDDDNNHDEQQITWKQNPRHEMDEITAKNESNEKMITTSDAESRSEMQMPCRDDEDDGCNSSVNLLADDDDGEANWKGGCQSLFHPNGQQQQQQEHHHHQQQSGNTLLPISPATETLDRLSKFSSVQGGAELCMHLLADAAAAVHASTSTAAEIIDATELGTFEMSHLQIMPDCGDKIHDRVITEKKIEREVIDKEHYHPNRAMENNVGTATNNNRIPNNDSDAMCSQIIIDSNKHQECLQKLKDYFMSTQNSAACAKQHYLKGGWRNNSVPPSIPFCLRCNHPAATASRTLPPHHGLCPLHADFFDSGSYEVLNLIVDGCLLLSCKACMYQFDNGGKLNKSLVHIEGCLRGNRTAKKKKEGSTTKNNCSNYNKESHDNNRKISTDSDFATKKGDNIDPLAKDEDFDSNNQLLSDYERLRLRNIERNNLRLTQLGLLAVPCTKSARKLKRVNKDTVALPLSTIELRDNLGRAKNGPNDERFLNSSTTLKNFSSDRLRDSKTKQSSSRMVSSITRHEKGECHDGGFDIDQHELQKPQMYDSTNKLPPKPHRRSISNKLVNQEEISKSNHPDHGKVMSTFLHQPTPSPLRPPQIPLLADLPSWIKEFSESVNDSPTRQGTKWLSCSNPWGTIGHDNNDVVIISPFQSDVLQDIRLSNIDSEVQLRFATNPLAKGSPYLSTHRSPARGGYSVLCLRRDRSCLRPWGFTVRLHEFGGACLVDSIEPLSPADAAEDISGWIDKEASSGLKPCDMVICINGKYVGEMTMLELQIEFDVCGSEMLLTVARLDIHEKDANRQERALKWSSIGAYSSQMRKKVSFEDGKSSTEPASYQIELPDSTGDNIQKSDSDDENYNANSSSALITPNSVIKQVYQEPQEAAVEDTTALSKTFALHANNDCTTVSETTLRREVVTLSMAAEFGCKKCRRELQTGIKTSVGHDKNCPRKFKPRKSKPRNEARAIVSAQTSTMNNRAVHRYTNKPQPKNASSMDGKGVIKSNSCIQSSILCGDDECLVSSDVKDESDNEKSSDSDDGDENPWLGCVCGKTHPHPIKVFWIQCEGCEAWYNAAEECLGFDEDSAKELTHWCCWACDPPVAGFGL